MSEISGNFWLLQKVENVQLLELNCAINDSLMFQEGKNDFKEKHSSLFFYTFFCSTSNFSIHVNKDSCAVQWSRCPTVASFFLNHGISTFL